LERLNAPTLQRLTSMADSPDRRVGTLLRAATGRLAEKSPTARLDAELLLAQVLGWSRARLLAERQAEITGEQAAEFAALLERRAAGEPVAYLIGRREFFGLELQVDRRVLVPRPETELLVEQVLHIAAELPPDCRIADIGTGSGAIAIALAGRLPQARIYATDLSADALDLARQNLERHGLQARVLLLQGDLTAPLPTDVDIIVSNPPYTILSEIDENVRRYEPRLALDGGSDGLAVYRRLIGAAARRLRPAGALLLEIGNSQGAAVTALLRHVWPTATLSLLHDLAGHERVLVARLHRPGYDYSV
jgi:release factor glutamine methyltransferase